MEETQLYVCSNLQAGEAKLVLILCDTYNVE